jgi:N6-L-threonylcarbamoyladenine synthase
MRVLGIESSCDETAAAICSETGIESNIIASQIADHAIYGGVVPEIASRKHVEAIAEVVDRALRAAGATLETIDAIAVTHGPGLVGCLLVGLSFAKALAMTRQLPIIGVNHLEGHLMSVGIEHEAKLTFPLVGLVVSGGHSNLYRVDDIGQYEILGRTLDDAAGEAFDKVAKLLRLSYPGGVVIDRLAKNGNPQAIAFPRALIGKESYDFSFSGLKTAVFQYVQNQVGSDLDSLSEAQLHDICASFQEAVVDILAKKTIRAAKAFGVKCVTMAGGVACNSRLRSLMQAEASAANLELFIPAPVYCTDNAAMIAYIGRKKLLAGERSTLQLDAFSR